KAHVSLIQTHGEDDGAQGPDVGQPPGHDVTEAEAARLVVARHEHYGLAADVDNLRDRLETAKGSQAQLRAKVQAQGAAMEALHLRAAASGGAAQQAQHLTQAVVLYMKALIGTFLAAGLACGGCVVTWQKPRHCCPSSRGEDGGAPKLGLKARRPPGAAARPPPVDGADGE
ncbi:unnamed protein product, partial [Prorocentrum cordatum]